MMGVDAINPDLEVEIAEAEKVAAYEREAGRVADPWPDLSPLAFHGVFGRIVQAIDPVTQADPAAVLVNLVVMFGSAAGRTAYFKADGARHYPNLFACLVGSTRHGAKGTSTSRAMSVLKVADEMWSGGCIRGGLASGEGVIYHLRDGDGKKDEGVTDKRLLALESEFAAVLKKAAREGSVLSNLLRQAWESGNLGNLTKNDPHKATGAHLSMLAHITPDELLRYMSSSETANGFGNRLLWAVTRRSKSLADGGNLEAVKVAELAREVAAALACVRKMGEVEINRTPAAAELWRLAYPIIDVETPGLIGALTARTPAQICRVALIFALADRRREIGPDHLLAAMSLVDFCNRSAAHIFGTGMGDRVQDEILACLQDAGTMTKAEMFGALQRHVSRDQLNRALDALDRAGRVVRVTTRPTGRGRPAETWATSRNRESMRKTPLGQFIEAQRGINRIDSQVSDGGEL